MFKTSQASDVDREGVSRFTYRVAEVTFGLRVPRPSEPHEAPEVGVSTQMRRSRRSASWRSEWQQRRGWQVIWQGGDALR